MQRETSRLTKQCVWQQQASAENQCAGEYPLLSMEELQAQVTAVVSHVMGYICSGMNLTLNSSINRLVCVFQTPPCRSCEQHSHFLVDSHLMTRACVGQGSRLKFGVQRTFHFIPSSCAHDVVVLTLFDSPFLFLLSIFSPIALFILQVFSFFFFFHDVGDKYPAHSRK